MGSEDQEREGSSWDISKGSVAWLVVLVTEDCPRVGSTSMQEQGAE